MSRIVEGWIESDDGERTIVRFIVGAESRRAVAQAIVGGRRVAGHSLVAALVDADERVAEIGNDARNAT